MLGIELLCAAQGLDYRKPLEPSPLVSAARDALRQASPPIDEDRAMGGDIEAVSDLVANGALVAAAGGLH